MLRKLWQRLGQSGFPFHPDPRAHGNPAMHRLRQESRRSLFARHNPAGRFAAKSAMIVLWPIGAMLMTLKIGCLQRAPTVKLLDAWWLAMRANVSPQEYFMHRLWWPERRARRDDYVYISESSLALNALNQRAGPAVTPSPVDEKPAFAEFCAAQGLPTPQIFSVWRKGIPISQATDFWPPETDLWLKPSRAKAAVGAERWIWREGLYHSATESLDPDAMATHVATHSKFHHETLVQAVIRAWPDHADRLGNTPLCARIITGSERKGSAILIDAMAIWPDYGSTVSQGGEFAIINPETGEIGPTYQRPHKAIRHSFYRDIIPDWERAVAAVCRGHAALSGYVFLGWDVAFGETGPTLLETNKGWGTYVHQILRDAPMGDGDFARIVAG